MASENGLCTPMTTLNIGLNILTPELTLELSGFPQVTIFTSTSNVYVANKHLGIMIQVLWYQGFISFVFTTFSYLHLIHFNFSFKRQQRVLSQSFICIFLVNVLEVTPGVIYIIFYFMRQRINIQLSCMHNAPHYIFPTNIV